MTKISSCYHNATLQLMFTLWFIQ